MPKTTPENDINPKLFNVLVVKQIATMLGNIVDMLKRLNDDENERQAYAEGFCRDILAKVDDCAEAIEKLGEEEKP